MIGYCKERIRRRENFFEQVYLHETSGISHRFFVKKFDFPYVINLFLWSLQSFITNSTDFLIMYPKYNLILYNSEWRNSSVTIVIKLRTERQRIRDQINRRKTEFLLLSKNLVQDPRPIKPPIQRAPLCRLLGLRVRVPSEAWLCLFWM